MSAASAFNKLSQTVMPKALAKAMPDTLTVRGEATSAGTGGGRVKSAATDDYTNVPCSYDPIQKFGWRKTQGEQDLNTQMYLVTTPTHTPAGTRINLDPKVHRLVVDARGNEPAKTFRIISTDDKSGVIFEVLAAREN